MRGLQGPFEAWRRAAFPGMHIRGPEGVRQAGQPRSIFRKWWAFSTRMTASTWHRPQPRFIRLGIVYDVVPIADVPNNMKITNPNWWVAGPSGLWSRLRTRVRQGDPGAFQCPAEKALL